MYDATTLLASVVRCFQVLVAADTVENKVRGYDKFTTATVKSKKRIQYGYFEARCRSMKASVCNAFWLYDPLNPPAKYREGSFSEEIDIFERGF